MEKKKEMTKALLGGSFKELMLRYPFEKITIKMITDEAGVIRPTFYNYFQDKYEVLEWIFAEEVLRPMKQMLENGMLKEGAKLLFVRMEKDQEFYRRAFEISGQNSFSDVLRHHIYILFFDYIEANHLKPHPEMKLLNNRIIAGYYALGITTVLRAWITGEGGPEAKAADVVAAYEYLLSHSIFDIIEIEEI